MPASARLDRIYSGQQEIDFENRKGRKIEEIERVLSNMNGNHPNIAHLAYSAINPTFAVKSLE